MEEEEEEEGGREGDAQTDSELLWVSLFTRPVTDARGAGGEAEGTRKSPVQETTRGSLCPGHATRASRYAPSDITRSRAPARAAALLPEAPQLFLRGDDDGDGGEEGQK